MQVEYVGITRDTTESDLKQRREIRRGTVCYEPAAPLRAALHGRVLLLEGVEKVCASLAPRPILISQRRAGSARTTALAGGAQCVAAAQQPARESRDGTRRWLLPLRRAATRRVTRRLHRGGTQHASGGARVAVPPALRGPRYRPAATSLRRQPTRPPAAFSLLVPQAPRRYWRGGARRSARTGSLARAGSRAGPRGGGRCTTAALGSRGAAHCRVDSCEQVAPPCRLRAAHSCRPLSTTTAPPTRTASLIVPPHPPSSPPP